MNLKFLTAWLGHFFMWSCYFAFLFGAFCASGKIYALWLAYIWPHIRLAGWWIADHPWSLVVIVAAIAATLSILQQKQIKR